jgi:hypothetical protein
MLVWTLLALSCASYSYSHALSPGKNNNARKILALFEFQKVLKTQKYTKEDFPVLQSYKLNKGDRWKIPVNQCKTWI